MKTSHQRVQYVLETSKVGDKTNIEHVKHPITEKNHCVKSKNVPKHKGRPIHRKLYNENGWSCDFDDNNLSLHKSIVKKSHFSNNLNIGPSNHITQSKGEANYNICVKN